jgi:hypothetical protein
MGEARQSRKKNETANRAKPIKQRRNKKRTAEKSPSFLS